MKINYFRLLVLFLLFVGVSTFAQPSIAPNNDFGYVAAGNVTTLVVPNVLANDYIDGNSTTPLTLSQVTLAQISSTSPFVQLQADGSVMVFASGIANGTYTIVYEICEIALAYNCNQATVTVNIGGCSVYPPLIGNVIQPTCSSPTGSISLNGLPASGPWLLNVYQQSTLVNQISGSGNSTSVSLSQGYYSFSVYDNTQNCGSIASALTSLSPYYCGLTLAMLGTYVDFNGDGFTNVGDVINYQFTVGNGGSMTLNNIGVSSYAMTITGIPITLAPGASDSTTFTATYALTQQDINSGYCSKSAYVSIPGSLGVGASENTTLNISDGFGLKAFIDSNGNGSYDSSERLFPYGKFNYEINSDGIIHQRSFFGLFYESNPSTSYNASYSVDSPYAAYYSTAATYPNITVPVGSGMSNYNFPLTALPYQDLEVILFASKPWPRPGYVYNNRLFFRNNSNQTVASGSVTFTKDNAVTITSTSPATTATPTGFTYNFLNLLPFEWRSIDVEMQVPSTPTVTLGQLVTSNATISGPAGDIIPANNSSSLTQTISNSYDPNEITECQGEKIVYSTFTANDYLTYTIQFENIGTASAINIKVNDVLDSKLDETSVRMVTASHNYSLERVDNNLTWKFDGINLPPSVADTDTGKGYIVFQVKPKPGYAVGDIIPNAADIYFDFNPAIVTNTFHTEFVATLAVNQFDDNTFAVYPNPTRGILNVSTGNSSLIESITINDVLGKSIRTQKVNGHNATIDLSQFSAGIYFVKVKAGESEKIVKVIKE